MKKLRLLTVTTKEDLNRFIKFPWGVYKNDPNWVPPIISDVECLLSDKNPFWDHSEKELFLLLEDDKIVGRVAGIIDQNYIKFQEEKAGFFGFLEFYDNVTYSARLLDAVKNWLKSKGMQKMYGPMNPSTNDEMGFLLEGFDSSPCLMMPYNPQYYLKHMDFYPLRKAKDLYAYKMDVLNAPFDRLERLAKITREKNQGIVIKQFNTKNIEEETQKALSVYNNAWEKNWGFVPWTRDEFYDTAKKLIPLLFKGTTLFVELNGEVIGMLIAVPDYNEVIKKLNGKLDLLGILKFLWYKNKIKGLRLMILGVKANFRKRGIESLLYYESAKSAKKAGFKTCEFSWILDDNIMTQRAAEMMGGKLYKKYRVYEMLI
jgi:hypothetical protein